MILKNAANLKKGTSDIAKVYKGNTIVWERSTGFNVLDPFNDGSAIAYYPFNGDSVDLISANNGTDTNVTYATGVKGQCASITGGGYIHTANRVPIPEEFSVSLWFNKSVTHKGWIVSNRSAKVESETEFQIGFYSSEDHMFFNIKTDDGWFTSHSTSILYNGSNKEWHYVTGVVKNNEVKIYVDGVLETTTEYTGTRNKGAVFTGFGCLWANAFEFEGKLDECHFFNRGLTDAEVLTLYQNMQ